jgi:hypothetical protein
MPTMWFLKDGRTAYTECGPGVPISFAEAVALFGTEEIRYVGPEPPSIGPDAPSEEPENVVVQLEDGEGSHSLLPEAGFYWVVSARPNEAAARLRHERGED